MIPILLTLGWAAAADPLTVTQAAVDKGAVKGGPPLAHTFELTHSGPAGLIVLAGVEGSCGCQRQRLSRLTLSPGEKATLLLEVNTLTQPEGVNHWNSKLLYRLELPGQPVQAGSVPLRITATLSREITVTPPMIAYSATRETKQTITITDTRKESSLGISQVTATSAHLKAELQPLREKTWSLHVTMLDSAPADGRTYDETVVVTTSDPAYPEFRIPVKVCRPAPNPITVSPESLTIRFAAGQSVNSAVVQLRHPDGKPLTIERIDCPQPGVTLSHSNGSRTVHAIRATIDHTKAGDRTQAEIVVTLSEPAGVRVTIPVTWKAP